MAVTSVDSVQFKEIILLTDQWHSALLRHALAVLDQLHVDLLGVGGVGGVVGLGVGALAHLVHGVVDHLELVEQLCRVAGGEGGRDVFGRGRGGRGKGVAGEVDGLYHGLGEVVVGAGGGAG